MSWHTMRPLDEIEKNATEAVALFTKNVVEAAAKLEARNAGMDHLWDARLDGASCLPIVTVKEV